MKSINCEKQIDGYKVALAVRQLEITGISKDIFDHCKEDVENILLQHGIFFKWTDAEKAVLKVILKEFSVKDEINEAIQQVQNDGHPVTRRAPIISDACHRLNELQDRIHKAAIKNEAKPACFVSEEFSVV
ncbi:hypothetical protein ACFL6P_00080 [Candidatus Latescibacterota bacterium]